MGTRYQAGDTVRVSGVESKPFWALVVSVEPIFHYGVPTGRTHYFVRRGRDVFRVYASQLRKVKKGKL